MLDLLQVHCPELKISNESYDWQLVPRDFVVMARFGRSEKVPCCSFLSLFE